MSYIADELAEEYADRVNKNKDVGITYQQAKKAIKLFESEYVGQNQTDLWRWAIDEAQKNK